MKAQAFLKIKHTGDGDRFQSQVASAKSQNNPTYKKATNAPARAKNNTIYKTQKHGANSGLVYKGGE